MPLSCCAKMFLNYFYLIACSRHFVNNTSVLNFNLKKKKRRWNSTSTIIFILSADFILMDEEFEKKKGFPNKNIFLIFYHGQKQSPGGVCKKGVLWEISQNSQVSTFGVPLLINHEASGLQRFSIIGVFCEIFEIFKNTIFKEDNRWSLYLLSLNL